MSFTRTIDHIEQGLTRLLDQYKNKPRIAAWASAYLRQCQLLEDATYDVLIKRFLDNATGEQLDVIGRIIGELRGDRDEVLYKVFLWARVRINRSRGNTDDVLAVAAIITITPIAFTEYRHACLALTFLAITEYDPVEIYKALFDTKAGGVKLTMVVPTTNSIGFAPMTYDGTSDPNFAVGDADALDLTYGLFSDVVTLRDPRLPFPIRIGSPVILYVDPPSGPEGP